jgi:hypothetical protein
MACIMLFPEWPQNPAYRWIVFGILLGLVTVAIFRLLRNVSRDPLQRTYWRLFKEKAWEIFWGPTMLGIIFGLVTLWWSPSLIVFLSYLLTVCFMAGYYLWRGEYVRLQPGFKVEQIIAQVTDTEDKDTTNMFLQVLPECLTDVPVLECRARLLLVSKLGGNGNWVPTQMNSPLKLGWDYYGYEPLTIEPGISQRLNICWWDNRFTAIIPTVDPKPSKIRVVAQFESVGCFTQSKLPWESRMLTNLVLFVEERQHHFGLYLTWKKRVLRNGNDSALIEQLFVVDSFDSRTGSDSCPLNPPTVKLCIIAFSTSQEKLRSYRANNPSLVTRNCVANGSRTSSEMSRSTFISGLN